MWFLRADLGKLFFVVIELGFAVEIEDSADFQPVAFWRWRRLLFGKGQPVMDAILTVTFGVFGRGILEDVQVELPLAPGVRIVHPFIFLFYYVCAPQSKEQ